MVEVSALVVEADFKRRLEEITDAIQSGRITFNNPPVLTEELLKMVAFHCTLLLLAEESKWN